MRGLFAIFSASLFCTHAAEPLLIAAASDLVPYEAQLTRLMSSATGLPVRFSFASSVSLRRQIAAGAPYDLFLSADEEQIRTGVRDGSLTAGSETWYATGRLGLWSRDGALRTVEQLSDRHVSRLAIANPKFAPYGRAAKQALERAGVWRAVQSRIVYGENVRQTFLFAETGNVDAALVSWSLVAGKGGVLIPGKLHDPIRQFGAVVKSSGRGGAARKALEAIAGPGGRRVLGPL